MKKSLDSKVQQTDFNAPARRRFAADFFSGLPKDQRISPEKWQEVTINLGEQIYFTTFTEDSDYIPGQMNFKVLSSLPKDIRKDVLNYANQRGNDIVERHIQDYLAQNHLPPLKQAR